MLNENFTLIAINQGLCTLSWQVADIDHHSYICINGKIAYGPIISDTYERTIDIPFPIDSVIAIEIHDIPQAEDFGEPIAIPPNTQPTIIWNAVSEAIRYRIYHRTENEPNERLIYNHLAIADTEIYKIDCPITLTGSYWHFFRVEAIDEYGNESTHRRWCWFVADLPKPASALTITEGSTLGTYTFILGG